MEAILKSLSALLFAAMVATMALLALGASPVDVAAALVTGAFGSWTAAADTLVKAMPLVFTGLAVALAFQAALWNIGAEGQLLAGAMVAAAAGPHLGSLPGLIALTLMLAGGAVGGAIWGGFCGWLKARRQVNEVISTIMMNFVALELVSYAVHGPLIEASGAYPTTDPISPTAQLHLFFSTRLNGGMVIAVLLAAGVYILLFRTETGFELRAMGKNRRASAFHGIPIARLTIVTMALSGALAGIGGAVQISAISHRLYERLSPGWGFEAIAVALIARLNPIAVIFAAIFFGALDNGAQAMQRTQGISPVLVQVIQAIVIFGVLALDAPGLNLPNLRKWFGRGDVNETSGNLALENSKPNGDSIR